MAVLSTADRQDAMVKFVRRYFVELARLGDLDVNEVQTLVNDLDAWLDSNQTSANSSITAAVRNKASTATKFAALAFVALKRGAMI